MESAEKVRLVKCPNCQNVLPELPDYSVYQCGGCGAVLHAKGEFRDEKSVPERCDDDGAVVGTVEGCPVRSAAPLGGVVSFQDVEPGVGSPNLERRSSEESVRDVVPGVGETKDRYGKGVVGVDVQNPNINMPGILLDGEDGGFRFRAGCESEFQKKEPVSGWRKSGAGCLVGSVTDGCGGSHGGRFSMFKYPDEGPSNCNFGVTCDSPEALLPGRHNTVDGGSGVHLLERDRAELLRKLDELKIQLSQSQDIGGATQEGGTPVNGGTVRQDLFGNSKAYSPVFSSMSREQFDAYRYSARLPFRGQLPNSCPLADGQNPVLNSDASLQYTRFGNRHVTQMHRSCPGPYDRVLPHGLISGQYLDPSCDPFGPVPTASICHQSTHACFNCNNDHGEAPATVHPSTFCRKYPNFSPNKKGLHYSEHPSIFRSHYIGPRYAVPPFISNLRHSHLRQPGQINSKGFTHNRAHRVVLFDGSRRGCPVIGGAPFLTCSYCLELLQLPRKFPGKAAKKGKIRCGACSSVISYDITNRKLVFTARTEVKKATAPDEDSSCEVIKGSYVQPHDYITAAICEFSSDDNDNLGQDGASSERQRVSSTGCNNLSLTNSQEMESIFPGISDQENSPTGLDNSGDSVQQVMNVVKRSPPPASSLQEHFDHSSRDHSANHFGKGNGSRRSDHEKALSNKAAMRQNSLQEATLATEMEMSFDEFSDNDVSGDSGDANREHDRPKGNKGESFLSNIFKKSFKDLSRSGQGEEHGKGRKVHINGHLIPDRSIKKAEKLAGPIQAGKYWYDFRAGFWGVMGGPCLGIIPPYIQEFNYPMKENCAGGDTGVFVNGRELHGKDLDLLATRGLPIDRERSYMIEISGRVYDEDTGEEMDCLGKLAPTVEKAKHGFGMKAPKAASD
ncbi:hypothetical protein MLD38_015576 [Melastoma candidum]|uniref:Uncharacterized protein n=1 Tax=Melastoma candidum TaxID=119954 RepID=A0ACB9RKQ8_9MYRT|nr:hypothetical protein MLD38_015576 [Melastoma candidum]